jgi:hypothetical protein
LTQDERRRYSNNLMAKKVRGTLAGAMAANVGMVPADRVNTLAQERKSKEETRRLNAEVPIPLHRAFKRKAEDMNLSMTELLTIVLTVFLEADE